MRPRHRLTAGFLALAAGLAGIPQTIPMSAPSVSPAPAQQTDKQQTPAPTPRAQTQIAYLGGGMSYYRNINPNGCPWPGRREACARRSSGKTRRMR